MRSLVVGLSVAAVLALSGVASADDKQFLCKPLRQDEQGFKISCSVVNGVVSQTSCGCGAGFVLVDPSATPSAVPPTNASER